MKGQRTARNRACERCHHEIADEWRGSRHHHSYDNDEFQRSVSREREPAFCVDCHAPESSRSGAPTAAEGQLGVGCVTCHLGEHAVLASPRAVVVDAPHAIRTEAGLATADACKKCHEFRFAQARSATSSEKSQWMQRTWSEHHDGNAEGYASCASCHMPRDGGHASHRFLGGHDEALVKSALAISARRIAPDRLELTLTPGDVTHAVPTGDLFRRLMISADTVPPTGTPAVRYLARHHQHVVREQRVEVADDRPFQGPRQVTLPLGADAGSRPIRYRVAYQRVDHLVGDDEAQAVVAGEIELASGTLTAEVAVPAQGRETLDEGARGGGVALALAALLALALQSRRLPRVPSAAQSAEPRRSEHQRTAEQHSL